MPKKYIRRRYRRKASKRGVRKGKVSVSVKKYVKRTISRVAENKYSITRAQNIDILTASGTTPTAVSLLPSLAVGSTRHQRIGNKIHLKKSFISGRMNLKPYNITTNPVAGPVAVKVWILSSLQYNEIGAFSGTSASTAFFKAETSPSGMAGNVLDLTSSVETENFKVYAQKTFYLGTTAATNNFPSTSIGAFDNSKFSLPFRFDISKHFKSALNFNDTASSSIPTNRNCWMVMQAISLDGQSYLGTAMAEMHYTIENHFEDI